MNNTIKLIAFCMMLFVFQACQEDSSELEQKVRDQEISNVLNQRTCGSQDHMEMLMKDPVYKMEHKAMMESLSKMTQRLAPCTNVITLPVAVHFQNSGNIDIGCLRGLAQSQIDALNDDYRGVNVDISNWINGASDSFPGINYGESCIQFCLATKNHPAGYSLTDGMAAVTKNKISGDQSSDWAGYINIFVRPGLSYLGYSPLGGKANGDGVVVSGTAFGLGAGCGSIRPAIPYNLGRTLTHELGHYFSLRHIWGDGACGATDFVGDTPNANAANYGCVAIGKASCGSKDLHMNYMDYTNDACMYMFTEGQVTRMTNHMNANILSRIKANTTVCGTITPLCNDGEQNGSETGVDCGGACAPCGSEATPTCFDNVQNGNETGKDCGGSCGDVCNAGSNGGGNNGGCKINPSLYAKFAADNPAEVKILADLIANANQAEVQKIVRLVVKNQNDLIQIMSDLNEDESAKQLLTDITSSIKSANMKSYRLDNASNAKVQAYLKLVSEHSDASPELKTIISEISTASKKATYQEVEKVLSKEF